MIIPLQTGKTKSFLIKEERTVLVDIPIGVSSEKFLKMIKNTGVEPNDISLIIITHGHLDHYEQLAAVKSLINAEVLCHEDAVGAIEKGDVVPAVSVSKIGSFLMKLFGAKSDNTYVPVHVEHRINAEYDLSGFGINAKIIPTPGHTSCSISIITAENQAIVGDFFLGIPFNPKKVNLTFIANDYNLMIESLKKLVELDCSIYYGSHGGPFSAEKLRTYLNQKK